MCVFEMSPPLSAWSRGAARTGGPSKKKKRGTAQRRGSAQGCGRAARPGAEERLGLYRPAIPAPTAACYLSVMAKNGCPSSQLCTRLLARGKWRDRARSMPRKSRRVCECPTVLARLGGAARVGGTGQTWRGTALRRGTALAECIRRVASAAGVALRRCSDRRAEQNEARHGPEARLGPRVRPCGALRR